MWRRTAVLLSLATSALGQTTPTPPGLDLPALAAALDPGPGPALVDLLPERSRALANAIFADAPTADLDRCVRYGPPDAGARELAAIARLLRPAAADAEAAELFAELRAALVVAGAAQNRQDTARLLGGNQDPDAEPLAAAARRQAQRLAARLLREHGSAPAANRALWLLRDELPAADRQDLGRAVLRRLGPDATPRDHLQVAAAAAAELDLAAARQGLAAARGLPAAAHDAEGLARDLDRLLTARLAGTEALERQRDAGGSAGELAELQLLQRFAPRRALERAEAMVAAGAAHALPFAIAASGLAWRGELAAADALLERAAELPGKDLLFVAVRVAARLLPALRAAPRDGDAAAGERLQQLLDDWRATDAIAAQAPGADAALYRLLRRELRWGEAELGPSLATLLPAAEALCRDQPESDEAARLRLAAAFFAADEVAGRAALAAPLPAPHAGDAELQRLRATAFVARHLRAGAPPDAAALAPLLQDLEGAGATAEAAWLRGIGAWTAANRGDAAARRAARDHFAAARQPLGQPGHWRAELALVLAAAADGEPHAAPTLQLQHRRDPWLGDDESWVPWLALVAGEAPADTVDAVERRAGRETSAARQAVLWAAVAARRADDGDAAAAAAAAQRALAALDATTPRDLPFGSGALSGGEFRYGLHFAVARPEVQVQFDLRVWPLPALPSEARLRQLAAAK